MFDKSCCEVLYDKCIESNLAKVIKVDSKPKSKYRPKPLDTVVGIYKLWVKNFKFLIIKFVF